jgi:serine/threonine-protein kinase HipA
MNREILVFVDLDGAPRKVGRLWTRVRAGQESASFEYDRDWIKNPQRFALEPSLTLSEYSFHRTKEKGIFGSLGDSAPDRWGRMLMRRAERRNAEVEGRQFRTLFESDFLLMVDDESRQGALRFKLEEDGVFLSNDPDHRIPPLIELPRLLSASERFIKDNESDDDLKFLLKPGSSLGGARPKASVRDSAGRLCLAKFPVEIDEYDNVSWEALALTLAKESGVNVPKWRLEKIDDKALLVIERFDRTGQNRIPFLSAMSMLSAQDNETHSYLEIADALRMHGAEPLRDLEQLWRRIAFNILISNTDDHLRNHGFLFASGGWELSPAYDLNPTPTDIRPRFLSTAIGLEDTTASLELALETAEYYGLDPQRAIEILSEIGHMTSKWRNYAADLGIRSSECDRMASAFEHHDLQFAILGHK